MMMLKMVYSFLIAGELRVHLSKNYWFQELNVIEKNQIVYNI